MIKRPDLLDRFEKELAEKTRPDYFKNLRLFEAMYEEAKHFGVLPPKDPLEGIEVDIRVAKAVNVRKSPGKNRSRSRQE
jgi:hypothetical protein